DASINSTNNINTVSPTVNAASIEDNVVDENIVYGCVDDPNILELEDIVYSDDDDEDVGAEADMNNLDAFMPVSPILTTRIHKYHPVEQIIGDLNLAPQTRRMTNNKKEHGLFSSVQQRTNHKDFQNCLFACFLSQKELKKVVQALKDPSWIEAMQEELLQFKLQEVWTLVELPNGKRAIGTKWVLRNKKDERAIRLFLAYASFKDFVVYQMDVKSAFLYGKIEVEVYVCQPPRFEDPDFPDREYKRGKDDIIFGSTKKSLCTEFKKMMHKKFQMSSMGELTFFLGLTHMETQKPLLKDEDGEEVDVILYRSMIGSLMYLTSSRPDIMFAVCACARYQVNPKVSRLHDVAYTDSDYAGASLDRKFTTGGCQFLGCRLISWQCMKQIVVANSTTEAEYVDASGINLLLLEKVNAARHKLTTAVES
ncbi:putative ribonuclease H-like domain-containing protein, partial [Tanacetum coccineum]